MCGKNSKKLPFLAALDPNIVIFFLLEDNKFEDFIIFCAANLLQVKKLK